MKSKCFSRNFIPIFFSLMMHSIEQIHRQTCDSNSEEKNCAFLNEMAVVDNYPCMHHMIMCVEKTIMTQKISNSNNEKREKCIKITLLLSRDCECLHCTQTHSYIEFKSIAQLIISLVFFLGALLISRFASTAFFVCCFIFFFAV